MTVTKGQNRNGCKNTKIEGEKEPETVDAFQCAERVRTHQRNIDQKIQPNTKNDNITLIEGLRFCGCIK